MSKVLNIEIIYYNESYNVYIDRECKNIPNIEEYLRTSLKNNTIIQIYKVPKIPEDYNGTLF